MTQIVAGIHLPENDRHFAEMLAGSELVDGKGTYQLRKLRQALVVTSRRGHAVDIGAQVGLWSRLLATEFGWVTAFEPVPAFARCFELNLYGVPNVRLRRQALSNESGVLRLATEPDIASAHVAADGDVTVEAVRLDDAYVVSPIDFVKVDCDGYEYEVLLGGEQVIRREKPTIVIEQKKRMVRYGHARGAGVDLLISWGAKLAWSDKGDHCLIW